MTIGPAPRRWACFAVLVVGMAALPRAARAADPPDSTRLAALQQAAATAPSIRVVSTRGSVFFVTHPVVTSQDVELTHPSRRAALFGGGVPDPPRRLHWEEVEHFDIARSRTRSATLKGFLFGAVVGGFLVGVDGKDLHDEGDSGVLLFACILTAGTSALGFAIGSTHPEIHHLYP